MDEAIRELHSSSQGCIVNRAPARLLRGAICRIKFQASGLNVSFADYLHIDATVTQSHRTWLSGMCFSRRLQPSRSNQSYRSRTGQSGERVMSKLINCARIKLDSLRYFATYKVTWLTIILSTVLLTGPYLHPTNQSGNSVSCTCTYVPVFTFNSALKLRNGMEGATSCREANMTLC